MKVENTPIFMVSFLVSTGHWRRGAPSCAKEGSFGNVFERQHGASRPGAGLLDIHQVAGAPARMDLDCGAANTIVSRATSSPLSSTTSIVAAQVHHHGWERATAAE
jgi:hypothetical protein